jgi:dUTP pyrophosphatase
MTTIKLQRLDTSKGLVLPNYATHGSAGMDLLSTEDVTIRVGEYKMVATGICIALPEGYEAQVRPRSGFAAKHGVTVLNTPGTIDSDYRGEIKVILINHGKEDFVITKGMRIAQMVIARYEQVKIQEVDSMDETSRGGGGFGSTGH